jgi:hypothetical protein
MHAMTRDHHLTATHPQTGTTHAVALRAFGSDRIETDCGREFDAPDDEREQLDTATEAADAVDCSTCQASREAEILQEAQTDG